jgi:hypothetical protein
MKSRPGLVSRVQSLTKARLIGWQFASDGDWEAAERVFLQQPERRTLSRIEHWLGLQTTENVALEALLESKESERFFLGVRISHLSAREKARVLERLIATGTERDGVESTIQSVRSVLGNQRLADGDPDYLELGVFDLWNRVKSVVVWKKSELLGAESKLVMPEELAFRAQKPDAGFAALHEPQPNALILEAAWKKNPDVANSFQCWIGLPVSDYDHVAGKYRLSASRYLSVVSTFIDRHAA